MDIELGTIVEPTTLDYVKDPIEYLVSVTTSCLLNEARYYEHSEQRRDIILQALALVEAKDPEFIPQLAVYIRKELGLRTTTNFLLAFCATSPAVSPFLKKYFSHATVLPGDLIECVQFTQFITNLRKGDNIEEIKKNAAGETFDIRRKITIPNQLKKVLIPKIMAFSEYQLGKHSSEGNRKSMLDNYYSLRQGLAVRRRTTRMRVRRGKPAAAPVPDEKQQKINSRVMRSRIMKDAHKPKLFDPAVLRQKAITKTFLSMKDLIELLHIKPTVLTWKVLGCKYPKTKEEFEKKFGEGGFDETLAGKRMKLEVPSTWETELSGKGNSKEVWTELVMNKKVPYLAMLRNLRNLIKVDLAPEVYEKVAKYISNPVAIQKARATPLQYFSALDEIRKLGLYNKIAAEMKKAVEEEPKQASKNITGEQTYELDFPKIEQAPEAGSSAKSEETLNTSTPATLPQLPQPVTGSIGMPSFPPGMLPNPMGMPYMSICPTGMPHTIPLSQMPPGILFGLQHLKYLGLSLPPGVVPPSIIPHGVLPPPVFPLGLQPAGMMMPTPMNFGPVPQIRSRRFRPNLKPKSENEYVPPPIHILDETITQLKDAVKKAIELSVKNLDPIKGVTQIFVDVSGSMKSPVSGGKTYGSVRQCFELSILLGLLVKKICEKCEYYIFSSPRGSSKCYIQIDSLLTGDIEKDMKMAQKQSTKLGGGTSFPEEVVANALVNKTHIDNMIILSDMMISEGFTGGSYVQRIAQYRSEVNPNLRVFSFDLRGYSRTHNLREEFKEHNFIRVYGASSSILKFISAKEGDQLAYIRSFAQGVIGA